MSLPPLVTRPDAMDLNADFSAYQQKVLDSLVKVTKTATHLSSQDLGFHRSSSDKVSKSLDQQGRHLLELTSKLLKAAAKDTNKPVPTIKNLDNIEDNWPKVVDVVDDQFEKVDASLDEYTGVIKRMSPAVQESPQPLPKAQMATKPYVRFPKVFDKPQTHFNRQVNNFETKPFKPLLTYKPHAIQSLEESIGGGSDGYVVSSPNPSANTGRYNHPYAYEIDQYTFPPTVYQSSSPIPFTPPEKTIVTFVDTEDAMLQMLIELKRAKEIAVDLEHHDYRSYVGMVCLIQISTREKDWIVDTLKPWREKLQILNEVLANPKILKVFHGSTMDMIWLQRDLGLYVVGLFDTYYASDALNLPGKGLKYLLQRFVNFEAQKQYQLADWRMRPLPTELIDYARSDTHYLLNVYDQLRNMLIEHSTADSNLVDFVLENSKKEALQTYQRFVYNSDSGRGSHGWYALFTEHPNGFDTEQFAVFRALHEWRDRKARELDESPVFLIHNKALWNLAESKPVNQTELHRFCRPVPSFVTDRFGEFKDVVFKAKRECKEDPPVQEMIKQNEVKYGVLRNRWRKVREAPKGQHDGIGAALKQLRLNGDVVGGQAQPGTQQNPESSPAPTVERANQSVLWGSVPSPVTPAEVEFALAVMAMNNIFPLQTMANGTAVESSEQLVTPPMVPEPMEDIISTTPAQEMSHQKNEVFTLKEVGRKRKATESMDISDDLSFANGDISPTHSAKVEPESHKAEKKRKKKEKKAKKNEEEQVAALTTPYDYAAQPSMLTLPHQGQATNASSSGKVPMNPFAKSLNTSTGARQNKMGKELQGKSMTFKS